MKINYLNIFYWKIFYFKGCSLLTVSSPGINSFTPIHAEMQRRRLARTILKRKNKVKYWHFQSCNNQASVVIQAQKQMYWLTARTESEEISLVLIGNWFLPKVPRKFLENELCCQQLMLGQVGTHMYKMKQNPLATYLIKVSSKWPQRIPTKFKKQKYKTLRRKHSNNYLRACIWQRKKEKKTL